ncbi:helix-turn-helix domain-containing protein [Aquimarina sp. AU474]|uniref:helix-turn-helix domain-containing protein n=1 Tax=Aquimarina sp. AU474 TaxID=2108529 RepID=UPI000D685B96|nr:helix-turn-helix domain-containing protein [Aquimarina sp. AU474]
MFHILLLLGIKNRYFLHLCIIILLLFNTVNLFAFQSSSDSLLTKEYTYLKKKIFKNAKDSSKAIVYTQSYLFKAKKDIDTIKIVNGFYYMSGITKDKEITEKYIDSMILYSKNLKTKNYPALAYYNKGKIEYNKGHFKNALDLYLKTNEKAEELDNTTLFYASKKSIGILKSRIGEHQNALIELKECYQHYSKLKKSKPTTYLSTLSALSGTYSLNKKLDSATILNRLGYKESMAFNKPDSKYYFTLNEGINLFYKKNFTPAKDSLSNVIEELKTNKDKANLSIAYFFYGKTLSALGKEKEAIVAHIKVDDIFQEISEIMPNNRENYEILINYYKKLGDKDNQLKYIKRLITVDSVLHTNYRYLMKAVVQNYDTPRLLSEKQKIIDNLETGKKTSRTIIIILAIISFLLLFLWLINRDRQKQYKRRFEELYHKQDSHKNQNTQPVSLKEKTKLAIPEESIKEILNQLTVFEDELGFIQPDLSINFLAKKFGTNSKYLSKIINTYKKKSFNHYINNLRIDQSIVKLKTDSKFRNYTIKAIAQEMGFNTTDAFSKAFYKQNGIHPSYFIKELQKQIETNYNFG